MSCFPTLFAAAVRMGLHCRILMMFVLVAGVCMGHLCRILATSRVGLIHGSSMSTSNASIFASMVSTPRLRCFSLCAFGVVCRWGQDFLRRSHRSVQSCVVHGKSLVGANTNNVSACLMSEVRRIRCIVEQLGAIMPGDCSSRWCVLGRLTPDTAEWDRMAWWLETRV